MANNVFPMLDIISNSLRDWGYSANQNRMEENSTDDKGNPVHTVCEIFDDKNTAHLLYTFDLKADNKKNFPYFEEKRDMVSMNDYLLFVEDAVKLYVFTIEMKTASSPMRQTRIGETFSRFVIERIHAANARFNKPVEFRKVGVKESFTSRPGTRFPIYLYDSDRYALLPLKSKFLTRLMMDGEISG